MKIKRQSPMTKKWHETDLPITDEQIRSYLLDGVLIQYAFPNLNKEQREFLKTGYTPKDWAEIFDKKIPDSAKDYVECGEPHVEKFTIYAD